MSRGIGAHANLVLQDDKTVIYEYGGYNLSEENTGMRHTFMTGR